MKEIKSLAKLLLLCLVISLTNCQKDEEVITVEQTSRFSFTSGTLEDFNKLSDFVQTDIIDYKTNQASLSRTQQDDVYDFTIINDGILSVVEPGQSTYTIKVVKNDQEPNSFSNLVVNFKDGEAPEAKIINYFPSQEYLNNIESTPDYLFKGSISVEHVDYSNALDPSTFRGSI